MGTRQVLIHVGQPHGLGQRSRAQDDLWLAKINSGLQHGQSVENKRAAIRTTTDAEVERIIHLSSSAEGSLQTDSSSWGVEDFDYGISVLSAKCNEIHWQPHIEKVLPELNRLRGERASAARNAEILRRLADLKKPHWTVIPNFWLTLIGAIAAVVAAWLAWFTRK
jgi:hypothetical protein